VHADIYFYNILPNTSDDANLEYLELYNSWSTEIDLENYILKDKSGKEYIFLQWEKLSWFDTKKVFRSETKIILNNSDEYLYLYNNFWELVDSYNYKTSEKDSIIQIFNIDSNINSTIDNNNVTIEDKIEIPNIKIDVQSGLEYLYWNTWVCPEKWKDICTINLNIEKVFSWSFEKNNYLCEWDFWKWFDFSKSTQTKCNPWYVSYDEWLHWIVVKIIDKNDKSNYKVWSISINNLEELNNEKKEISYDLELNKYKKKIKKEKFDIKNIDIIVQSWLSKNNECMNKKNCLLNLKYNQYSYKIRCRWDFWWWVYPAWSNQKCDPRYVKYDYWKFEISLKIYENNNKENYKISKLNFTNFEIKKKIENIQNNKEFEEKIVLKKQKYSEESKIKTNEDKKTELLIEEKIEPEKIIYNEIYKLPISNIKIQWKVWKNKIVDNNNITCIDTCSINFDWSSSSWTIKKYLWDFWNWKKFEWVNPWYIKYENLWSYKVVLTTISEKWDIDISNFNVNYIKKQKAKKTENLDTNEYINFKQNNEIKKIESKKQNNEIKITKEENNKKLELLFYIIIFILTLNMVILILKKEKLIDNKKIWEE